MKRLLANTLMLAGGLTASSHLLALGLGELQLKSALNQPLSAEIALLESQGLSQWEIKPALASAADFERAGVDRLYFLTKLDFKVEGDRIVVSSREPVNEPFLNFLIELNWPAGRVLREYTVLLDPPTFEEQSIQPLVATPYGATTETVAIQPPAQPAVVNRWESEPAAPGSYKVQKDDTLWEIALSTRPDRSVSAQQMMLAIQAENPNAFIGGNINRLKTHQVLSIPDADRVRAIAMGTAVQEVERQNRELNSAAQIDATGRAGKNAVAGADRSGGEVRLVAPSSSDAESAGASGDVAATLGSGRQQALENDLAIALENVDKSRRENQELRQRLEALEEQINTLQRLITLKDDQLASMQVEPAQVADDVAQQSEAVVAEAEQPVVETEQEAVVESEDAVSEEAQAPVDQVAAETEEAAVDFNYAGDAEQSAEASEPVAAEAEAAKAAENAEERRKRIAALIAEQEEARRPEPTLVDQMMAQPQIPLAGLGILALIGALVARMLKKRKEAKEEQEDDLLGEELAFAEGDVDAESLDDLDFDDELATAEFDGEPLDELDLGSEEAESEEHFETIAQTEDVISESDIYIAYGKFEQAVDLLTDAIAKEPSRSDLRLKLLEVYVEMDESQLFAAEEGELQKLGDRQASEQAQIMRNRLSSPMAPMAGGDLGEFADGGLSLDDDIPSLDDGLGDEFADGIDFGDALDMSGDMSDEAVLAESSDDVELTAVDSGLEEVPTLDLDDGLDFDLSEEAPVLDALESNEEAPLAELPAAADDSLDFDLSDFDAPAEQAGEEEILAEAIEAPVAEEDDSLEFDLSSFESPAAEFGEAAPEVAEEEVTEDDALTLDFALDSDAAAADLEDLLDGKTEGEDLSELSFDMEEETGFAAAEEDDLQALEDELTALSGDDTVVAEEAPVVAEDGFDFSADMDDLDSDLGALDDAELPVAEETVADEAEAFDVADLEDLAGADEDLLALDDSAESDADIPQIDEVIEDRVEPVVPDDLDISTGEIDLDELAAAEDEFDFLAGTDECATKLDLARAYIDMEDVDGARELLQEVVQEGSDQQKAEARELMDGLS
jgi:pilus assembly protein FimV